MKKKYFSRRTKEMIAGYLFVSLWIIGFVVFALVPIIQSIQYSFNQVILGPSGIQLTNIGFQHYIDIFTKNPPFLMSLSNYILKTILYVPIILVFSLMIAMLLNQKIKFKGFFRAIFFLPVVIISGPIISELIKQGTTDVPVIASRGVIDGINSFLPEFLASPISSLLNEFIMILWFSGVPIVLFLAALQKQRKEIYEAAYVDGASSWEIFWKITLPSLSGIILLNMVYTTITLSVISTDDGRAEFVAPKTPLGFIKDATISTGTQSGYGYASALSFVYFFTVILTLGILLLIFAYFSRRKEK